MFNIVRSLPTRPGRFEHQFWCEFKGTVGHPGEGWSNEKSYAIQFATQADADKHLTANKQAIGDRGHVSQIVVSL